MLTRPILPIFKYALNTCLPIILVGNRSQQKESMRGALGFAEVELKLSTNAARCEGLSYLLSLENIYIKY